MYCLFVNKKLNDWESIPKKIFVDYSEAAAEAERLAKKENLPVYLFKAIEFFEVQSAPVIKTTITE